MTSSNHGIIRIIYLYLFALVGLFLLVFSSVSMIGAVSDRYVFPQAFVEYKPVTVEGEKPAAVEPVETQRQNFEKQQDNDFRRRANQAMPGIIIGWLLWRFHWNQIQKDKDK